MINSFFSRFFAFVWAYLFCLRGLLTYQICTQYEETRIEGEWDTIFIGVVKQEIEQHPDFPVGRYVWKPVRTYWGEFNQELARRAGS